MNHVRTLLCTIAGLCLSCVIAPPVAQAAETDRWTPLDEGIYTIEPNLDVNVGLGIANASTANDANVELTGLDEGLDEKWSITFDNSGAAKIVSLLSGKTLTAELRAAAANICVRDDNGSAQQRWMIEVQDDGTYLLKNCASDYVIDLAGGELGAGTNVRLSAGEASATQRFTFESASPLADGVYTLFLGPSSNFVVDVPSASADANTSINAWSANNSLAQKWLATRQSDGAYTFESLCSGLLLTATGTANESDIVQAAATGAATQRFYVEPTSGGTFQLRLKNTNRVVDLSGAEFSDGANIHLWDANTTDAQKIRFSTTTPLPSGYYTIGAADNSNYSWDVDGGSISAGANLQLWGAYDNYSQVFAVTDTGGGVYEIGLCESPVKIGPAAGSAAIGANLQQCDPNSAPADRWKITYRGNRSFSLVDVTSNLAVDVAGGWMGDGANVQLYLPNESTAQRFVFTATAPVEIPFYHGFQNPPGYYQVSDESVWFPHLGENMFGYRTPSRLSKTATKSDCIETMIGRAYEYIGTPYYWDYSCAPGVGVDCAGLVLQALYATGMDLWPMNPWDHYYTPGHDHYAGWMASSDGFLHVPFSERQRGDLIFYSGHVAIYLGNDQIIDAYTTQVSVANIYSRGTVTGVGRPYI